MFIHPLMSHYASSPRLSLQDILSILNLIILTGTGVIVGIYTKAAQRSNELQEEPLINFNFKDTSVPSCSQNGILSIKNIGKGPAYNISIEKFDVSGYSYRFFLENPLLEQLEDKPLKMFVKNPKGNAEASDMMFFLSRLNPQTITQENINYARENPAIFLSHFKGTNGKTYHTVFAFYSTLPPVGEMVMQFVTRGSGSLSMKKAREKWRASTKIPSWVED